MFGKISNWANLKRSTPPEMNRIGIYLFLLIIQLISYASFAQEEMLDDKKLSKSKEFKSIEEALEKPEKVYKLNLSNKNLTVLPADISKFKNLQKLDLSSNKLKAVPKEITKLRKLQSLNLSKNTTLNLSQVFGFFGKSKILTEIILTENTIRILPDNISKIQGIQTIDLSYNPELNLKQLFKTLSKLPNLKTLSLVECNLTSFPDEIGGLKASLRELNINWNRISETERQRLKGLLPNTIIVY
jgi:leucine-rich repeat protein SHOC2